MAGFLKKLFGKNEETVASQEALPASEAERKLDEIRRKIDEIKNAVMDLQSKGKAISANRERLRAEIRQKEQENQKLMDEYESLPDGLEKDMVMGTLEANEDVLDELRERVNGLNKAWGDNEKILQVVKRARERIESAISAGKSPTELVSLINEIAREGEMADIGIGLVADAAGGLSGTATESYISPNREKVLARLAARKGAQDKAGSQISPVPSTSEASQISRPMSASQL